MSETNWCGMLLLVVNIQAVECWKCKAGVAQPCPHTKDWASFGMGWGEHDAAGEAGTAKGRGGSEAAHEQAPSFKGK